MVLAGAVTHTEVLPDLTEIGKHLTEQGTFRFYSQSED